MSIPPDTDNENEWMSPAGASAVLRRSERQIRTYASRGRLRSRRRGPQGKTEYWASDVYRLAAELGSDADPPRVEVVEVVPSVQLAAQVERLQGELRETLARAERAEAALRLLPPPEEAHAWRAERDAARIEAASLRDALAQARGSSRAAWWIAVIALAVALLAVAAVVIVALIR